MYVDDYAHDHEALKVSRDSSATLTNDKVKL